MRKIFLKITYLFGCATFIACSHSSVPAGKALATGSVTDASLAEYRKDSITVSFGVPSCLKEAPERIEYETKVAAGGTFTVDIPLLYPTFAMVSVNYQKPCGMMLLQPGKETQLEISLNEKGEAQIQMVKGKGWNKEVLDKLGEVCMELLPFASECLNCPSLPLDTPPEIYRDSMIVRMEKDLSIVTNSVKIPDDLKPLLYNTFKLHYLKYFVMDYEGNMRMLYQNMHLGEDVDENDFIPATPDKSYYSVLKDFDLNNPSSFDMFYYPIVLEDILYNETLNIPPVGDIPGKAWQQQLADSIGDLVGVKAGLFYDMLLAKSYCRQFTDDFKPLSEQQKKNILDYFENPTFSELIFAENEKVMVAAKEISKYQNTTPDVPKEKLIDAIISQYKGKAVVFDFWATWCGPCIDAMEQSKTVKKELQDKNVVFVYLTNPSSKAGLWKQRVVETGGEHYWLSKEEWKYLLDSFDFQAIPTYLFFDANGKFRNKITAYPGNAEMKKMIEELLQ